MPTYDYKCEDCGRGFEIFQQMSDTPVKACPHCGGKAQRLIGTGAAVIFKDSGFHSTDYRTPRPSCGRDALCCGRDVPCKDKTCDQ